MNKISQEHIPSEGSSNESESVYIAPGDVRREGYRMATLQKYPRSENIDVRYLAENGFYFTGEPDKIICFRCGKILRQRRINEIGRSTLHYDNCEMLRGDPSNVPIQSYFNRFHLNSQQQQQQARPHVQQNIQRRVDTVLGKQNSFTNNATGSSTNIQQVVSQSGEISGIPNDNIPKSLKSKLKSIYPCKNAVNPHMQSFERRLETFDRRWNGEHLTATPRKIAEAGFFFLGESDRTKCWYCSGGLQNWEAEDDAMFEHAKWFPGCEFVLQTLGPQKIKEMFDNYPNIPRPPISNGVDYRPGLRLLKSSNRNGMDDVVNDFLQGEIAQRTKQMGFTETAIQSAVNRLWRESHCLFSTSEELIEALLTNCQDSRQEPEEIANSTRTQVGVPLVIPTASQNNQVDARDRICKTCRKARANFVNLPCGHLSQCENCSKNSTRCAICKNVVSEKFKVYLP